MKELCCYAGNMKFYGPLDNYISTHRNETGLSQDELAVLLGLGGHEVISKYEQGKILPELPGIIALETILDEPIQSIFAGVAERVRSDIARRARALLEGTTDKPTAHNAQKLSTLWRLSTLDENDAIQWRDTA